LAKRVIVLTGGIGSGKSLAADHFAAKGITVVDADALSRAAQAALALAPDPYAIYMVPLWIETHRSPTQPGPTEEPVEGVIVVDCAQETQIQRVMQRSGLTREDVLAIMATQASREERREKATHLLNNDGGIEQLAQQVDALHEQLIHS